MKCLAVIFASFWHIPCTIKYIYCLSSVVYTLCSASGLLLSFIIISMIMHFLNKIYALSMEWRRFPFDCRWFSLYNFVCDKLNLESCLLSRGHSHRTCFSSLLCLTMFDHCSLVSLLLQHLMHDTTFPKAIKSKEVQL